MAIAKMSHIRLVGLKRDQNKILDSLTSHGLFEARATDCVEKRPSANIDCDDKLPKSQTDNAEKISIGDTEQYRKLKLKQSKLAFALDFLKQQHNAMQSILKNNKRAVKRGLAQPIDYELSDIKYGGARALISRADFSDAAAKECDLLGVCDDLEKISFKLVEYKSRINSIKSEVAAYLPFVPAKIKLSEQKKHGGIVLTIFSCHAALPKKELLDSLPCAYELRRDESEIVLITISTRNNADAVEKQLTAAGLVRCPFDDDCTAMQKVRALTDEKADIEKSVFAEIKNALHYEKYYVELCTLYDVFELDIERAVATEKFAQTESTFILEGWLPEFVAESTVAEVKERFDNVFIQLLAPEEKDEPPTLVVNNAVVKPYEQITDMYSSPRYREIDPNPIMSVFYFLFFGIMIGDAAYGLILAIAGLIVGRSKKFDTGAKRLALLVGMGGISAILWGILFGGYFSIDFGDAKVALWFNPLENPMMMLVLSIVLGCVQMTVGYIIKFVALCKEGKPFSAIFDCGSIIMLFVALGCVGVNMFVLDAPIFALTVVSIVLVCLGIGLMIIFGGRKNKNVFGKIFGGFKGLYGLVNLLSDALSYCRLFGLNLASCAIGLAFNSLGGILFGVPIIGYVLGVILLIPLHIFNLALGVLSAYVHDARLQFLEFYSKFYDGGGRMFSPLGVTTKYVRFG